MTGGQEKTKVSPWVHQDIRKGFWVRSLKVNWWGCCSHRSVPKKGSHVVSSQDVGKIWQLINSFSHRWLLLIQRVGKELISGNHSQSPNNSSWFIIQLSLNSSKLVFDITVIISENFGVIITGKIKFELLKSYTMQKF